MEAPSYAAYRYIARAVQSPVATRSCSPRPLARVDDGDAQEHEPVAGALLLIDQLPRQLLQRPVHRQLRCGVGPFSAVAVLHQLSLLRVHDAPRVTSFGVVERASCRSPPLCEQPSRALTTRSARATCA